VFKTAISIIACFLLAVGHVGARDPSESGTLVPLVALIVDPESYEGIGVSTAGYLALIFDRPMLFLTREHEWMDDMRSAIPVLSADLEACLDSHVELHGTFIRRDNERDYAIGDVYRATRTTESRDVEVCFSERAAHRAR
jgi:hypothetical protein